MRTEYIKNNSWQRSAYTLRTSSTGLQEDHRLGLIYRERKHLKVNSMKCDSVGFRDPQIDPIKFMRVNFSGEKGQKSEIDFPLSRIEPLTFFIYLYN